MATRRLHGVYREGPAWVGPIGAVFSLAVFELDSSPHVALTFCGPGDDAAAAAAAAAGPTSPPPGPAAWPSLVWGADAIRTVMTTDDGCSLKLVVPPPRGYDEPAVLHFGVAAAASPSDTVASFEQLVQPVLRYWSAGPAAAPPPPAPPSGEGGSADADARSELSAGSDAAADAAPAARSFNSRRARDTEAAANALCKILSIASVAKTVDAHGAPVSRARLRATLLQDAVDGLARRASALCRKTVPSLNGRVFRPDGALLISGVPATTTAAPAPAPAPGSLDRAIGAGASPSQGAAAAAAPALPWSSAAAGQPLRAASPEAVASQPPLALSGDAPAVSDGSSAGGDSLPLPHAAPLGPGVGPSDEHGRGSRNSSGATVSSPLPPGVEPGASGGGGSDQAPSELPAAAVSELPAVSSPSQSVACAPDPPSFALFRALQQPPQPRSSPQGAWAAGAQPPRARTQQAAHGGAPATHARSAAPPASDARGGGGEPLSRAQQGPFRAGHSRQVSGGQRQQLRAPQPQRALARGGPEYDAAGSLPAAVGPLESGVERWSEYYYAADRHLLLEPPASALHGQPMGMAELRQLHDGPGAAPAHGAGGAYVSVLVPAASLDGGGGGGGSGGGGGGFGGADVARLGWMTAAAAVSAQPTSPAWRPGNPSGGPAPALSQRASVAGRGGLAPFNELAAAASFPPTPSFMLPLQPSSQQQPPPSHQTHHDRHRPPAPAGSPLRAQAPRSSYGPHPPRGASTAGAPPPSLGYPGDAAATDAAGAYTIMYMPVRVPHGGGGGGSAMSGGGMHSTGGGPSPY